MRIIVKGKSMEPTMFEGETYIVRPKKKYCKGDVIVANIIGNRTVVKRIYEVHTNGFRIVGDNWELSTRHFVRKRNIIGKVIRPTFFTRLARRIREYGEIKKK